MLVSLRISKYVFYLPFPFNLSVFLCLKLTSCQKILTLSFFSMQLVKDCLLTVGIYCTYTWGNNAFFIAGVKSCCLFSICTVCFNFFVLLVFYSFPAFFWVNWITFRTKLYLTYTFLATSLCLLVVRHCNLRVYLLWLLYLFTVLILLLLLLHTLLSSSHTRHF
jgi:hypothetical protein